MTLIEDAKRLADSDITQEGTVWCHFCRGMIEDPGSYDPPLPYSEQHDADCPWLVMPRIVVALEAAERYLRSGHPADWFPAVEAMEMAEFRETDRGKVFVAALSPTP